MQFCMLTTFINQRNGLSGSLAVKIMREKFEFFACGDFFIKSNRTRIELYKRESYRYEVQ